MRRRRRSCRREQLAARRQPGQRRRLRLEGCSPRRACSRSGAPAGLTARGACPGSLLAGAVQSLSTGPSARRVYGTLWLGHPLRAMARMLADFLPAATVMVALAALTIVLTAPLGLLALALFARHRRAAADRAHLRRAHAPGRAAGRADAPPALRPRAGAAPGARARGAPPPRRAYATLAFARRAEAGDPIAYARRRCADPSRASVEAGHVGEWWNGGGGPAGLRGAGHAADRADRRRGGHLERADRQRRPAAQPRRGARGARQRQRHPVRPARGPRRARRRGRGARLGRPSRRPSPACTACACPRRCAASSPLPDAGRAAQPRVATSRTISWTSRAVRSQ